MRKILLTVMVFSLSLVWCDAGPRGFAWSREWKPSATQIARDYAVIADTRTPGDIKMIFWMAPPMLPEGKARQLLENYVVIGVVRGRVIPGGTMSFDNITTLPVTDAKGTSLRLLSGDEIPPVLAGTVAVLTSAFGQSFGAFGKGFHWFVFEAGSINVCKDGGLSVPFAGEVYTYQTPFPGCVTTPG
jgi:hypothetical protein